MEQGIIWQDKKRTFLGMPLSFTKYSLSKEKLFISTGVLKKTEDEIRLYRILDITLTRGFGQRLLGLGSLMCNSADKSQPVFEIKNIRRSREVRDMLSDLVEEQRELKRISGREVMVGDLEGSGLASTLDD